MIYGGEFTNLSQKKRLPEEYWGVIDDKSLLKSKNSINYLQY
jgi:hypothetical protein